jgi:hypothetical protein
LVLCGLLVGLCGLWMTLLSPWPAGDGALLYALRLLFGSAMVVSIVLGFTTIRRGYADADPDGRGNNCRPAE